MEFYNENGSIIKCNTNFFIGSGAYGSVYRYLYDRCIKLFDLFEEVTFCSDVFKIIRRLRLSNFGILFDLLYEYKDGDFLGDEVLGYISKYYIKENVDILTMPINYTIDNLYGLYNSIKILTGNNVRTLDLGYDNAIVNNSGIIVKDIDLYYMNYNLSNKELFERNMYDLVDLFITLYSKSISLYHEDLLDNDVTNLIYNLFTIDDDKGIDATYKKLCRYKYPIDYIKRNKDFYR